MTAAVVQKPYPTTPFNLWCEAGVEAFACLIFAHVNEIRIMCWRQGPEGLQCSRTLEQKLHFHNSRESLKPALVVIQTLTKRIISTAAVPTGVLEDKLLVETLHFLNTLWPSPAYLQEGF